MNTTTLLWIAGFVTSVMSSLVVYAIKTKSSRTQKNFDKLFAQNQRLENLITGITKDVGANIGRIGQIERRLDKHGSEIMRQQEINAITKTELKFLRKDGS